MTLFGLLSFDVLFSFVLQQSEIFIGLLQSVVLSVESVDHVVFVGVDLIFDVKRLFDELCELLHLLSEQAFNLDGEFLA